MAEPFLSDLRKLLDACALAGCGRPAIDCRHFFSGAAAYADGKIFMSLSPVGLALKLPEADCRALLKTGGRPLRYFPMAPVKKGYVVLPEGLSADVEAVCGLIRQSLVGLNQ